MELHSDDVVFGGVTPEPMDKAGVVAFHENFYSAFPGTQVEVLDLIETGDQLAARLVLSGPHEGPFLGAPASGNDVQLAITTIPSRERYLLLNHRLARRIVKAHTDWLDEVERELG